MGKTPTPSDRPRDWGRWFGFALLAVVIALIAKPVWATFELLCMFPHMVNMNG